MDDEILLIHAFEQQRPRLHAVAYRMLGSLADADDALQETWIRVARAGSGAGTEASAIVNPAGWLTTITARVCLNMIRTRGNRREVLSVPRLPDPIVLPESTGDPEHEAALADSVSLALLVVVQTLSPPERLAFILHDMFAVPFDEIATVLDRSTEAVRQLASRGRSRVRTAPAVDTSLPRQREIVDAFYAAARGGDFDGLVALLHPDVVLHADGGTSRPEISHTTRGNTTVAGRAIMFQLPNAVLRPVLVNGSAGVVVEVDGTPFSIMGFRFDADRIVGIDVLADTDRLRTLPGLSSD